MNYPVMTTGDIYIVDITTGKRKKVSWSIFHRWIHKIWIEMVIAYITYKYRE